MWKHALRLVLTLTLAVALPRARLKEFEKRVTEFTLPNGMHFIVLERHEAPVVSFHSYVNAGSVDDPGGQNRRRPHVRAHGVQGTDSIGTKNWAEERKALEAIEKIYDRLQAEQNLGFRSDPAKIKDLESTLKAAIEKANSFVDPNVYPALSRRTAAWG